jgi:hypothetical protein
MLTDVAQFRVMHHHHNAFDSKIAGFSFEYKFEPQIQKNEERN